MIPFLAPLALKLSPLGGVIKRIPRPVWIALAVVAALAAGAWWHGRQVRAFGAERFAAGYAKRVAEETAEANARASRDAAITAPIRSKTDETIRDNARHADALRLRGPGAAAACVDPAAAAARRPGAGPGRADAAVDRLPDEERSEFIALPFAETIDRAERCDANLAEVLAWREQRAKLEADRQGAAGRAEGGADAAAGR